LEQAALVPTLARHQITKRTGHPELGLAQVVAALDGTAALAGPEAWAVGVAEPLVCRQSALAELAEAAASSSRQTAMPQSF
jgi:hypothetical protein